MQEQDTSKTKEDVSLRKLQLAELEILKSVTLALDENNIQYYLGFGTLLGAVRHQGFIPWDDDVDLFLPRPDYERFIEMADQILEKPYYLYRDEKKKFPFDRPWLRVESSRLQNVRRNGAALEIRNVQIDISALDGIPESNITRYRLFFCLRILYILWRFANSAEHGVEAEKSRSMAEKIGIWLNEHIKIGKLLSAETLLACINRMRRKYSYEKYDSVYTLVFDYPWKKLICRKEWFGTGEKAFFEGNAMSVPSNSNAVLRQIYGDYMKLPPKEERICKHIVGIIDKDENMK